MAENKEKENKVKTSSLGTPTEKPETGEVVRTFPDGTVQVNH